MKHFASVIALAGLVAAGSALAKPGDVYLLGHYTHSNFNGLNSIYENDVVDGYTFSSIEQKHNRYGFGAGYVLDNTWSFELGYKDLGRFNGEFDYQASRYSEHSATKISSQALVLRSIAAYPITPEFKLEGSIGLSLTRAKLTADVSDNEGDYASYYERRTTLAPTLGVGASYALGDNLSLFGRYEYIHNAVSSKLLTDDDSEDSVGTIHASTLDMGLRYTF